VLEARASAPARVGRAPAPRARTAVRAVPRAPAGPARLPAMVERRLHAVDQSIREPVDGRFAVHDRAVLRGRGRDVVELDQPLHYSVGVRRARRTPECPRHRSARRHSDGHVFIPFHYGRWDDESQSERQVWRCARGADGDVGLVMRPDRQRMYRRPWAYAPRLRASTEWASLRSAWTPWRQSAAR